MTALLFKHSTSQAYGKKMHTMTDVIFLPFIAYRRSRVIPAGAWINIFKTTGKQAVIKACKHMCFPFNLLYLSLCHKHTCVHAMLQLALMLSQLEVLNSYNLVEHF